MKLAIMQPYFFPYLGYFSLIQNTDQFILLDDVQFKRHGWIERNRILKPNEGWQYINVPLEKHSREILIKDIRIRKTENLKVMILKQLEHYKKSAPYFSEVIAFLNKVFNKEFDSIVKLNAHLLTESCNYLEIKFNYQIFSEMNLEIKPINAPGDWALNISKAMNANEYLNPIGGIHIFDEEAFKAAKIKLSFLKLSQPNYMQGNRLFEPGLSIIDVLMNCGIERTKELINQFELV
ncbi:MAG: WbqC family protein [Bacteroidales bacterium]